MHSIQRTVQPQRILYVILLVYSLFSTPGAKAQPIYQKGLPLIKNYTLNNLSSASAQFWTAIQDNRGYIYVGSSNSQLVYDGINWKDVLPEEKGKTVSVCRAYAKDDHGRIFYGGVGDFGYLRQDSVGNTRLHSLLKFIPDSLRNFLDTWSIYTKDNKVYFQTRDYIFLLTETGKYEKEMWTAKTWKPQSKFMYAFYLDDNYFVHQQGLGLFRMVKDSLRFIPGSEFTGAERMQIMLPYNRGTVDKKAAPQYLLGLFYSGMYLYDGEKFTSFKTEADLMLKTGKPYRGMVLNDGTFALGAAGSGLVVIDNKGKLVQKVGLNEGLQDDAVYGILQDKSGNLWLAMDAGISKLETASPFSLYNAEKGIRSNVLCIRNFENEIYLGTSNGILHLNPQTNRFENIAGIPVAQSFDMAPSGKELFFTTDGLYAIKDNKAYAVRHSISGDMAFTCLAFSKKFPSLLFCGSAFGLAVFINKHSGAATWEFSGFVPGIKGSIVSLVENEDGIIWAGSNIGKYFRISPSVTGDGNIDMSATKFSEYHHPAVSQAVTLIKIGKPIYIAADSTVLKLNESTQLFELDTTFWVKSADGNLLNDETGRVWAFANRKLRLFTPQENGTFKVDSTSLLRFTSPDIVDVHTDENKITWLAYREGIVRYDQSIPQDFNKPYTALLRFVKSAGNDLNPDPVLNKTNKPVVAYEDNAFRFEYAAPFFDLEEKMQFQTWLEGFEKSWSHWGNNSYKEYTNLPEGDYQFHIRALNAYDNISDESVYSFTIQPPWFRTWWAYALVTIITCGIIWVLIRYWSGRLRRKNRLLEEKVSNRTAQLNQSILDLKATQAQLIQSEKMASLGELTAGIAHEIQNPLNFVNNFSEVSNEMLAEMKAELASDSYRNGNSQVIIDLADNIGQNLEKINHHGKRADAIVKGMMQHSRSGAGHKELTDINALADEYLKLAYHGLRAKDNGFNTAFKTDFDKSIGKINIIPQDIGRVLLNLYNNAFYAVALPGKDKTPATAATTIPTVWLTTKKEGNTISISVKDNGPGVPASIIDKIFQPFFTTKPTGIGTGLGLSLAYDIVKAHGGELKVRTEEGKGSEFIIQLPVS